MTEQPSVTRADVHGNVVPMWRGSLNTVEEQRLDELDARLLRKQQSIAEIYTERFKIRRRAIARIRRAKGKT